MSLLRLLSSTIVRGQSVLHELVSRHDGARVLDEIEQGVERLRGDFDAASVEVR